MAHYHIPAHISFAVTTDAVIFMDVRTDCYRLLAGPDAHLFRLIFSPENAHAGGPHGIDFDDSTPTSPESRALITTLIAGNILTTGLSQTRAPSVTLPEPRRDLHPDLNFATEAVRSRDIWHFWTACLRSSWNLRVQPIEHTIRAVKRRGELNRSRGLTDLHDLSHHVALFRRLRPLYPRDFLCLFDSLALLEFLAPYGFFPHWVFAVSLTPWSAHCWVQHKDVVINECTETASRYITVLIV